MTDGNKPDDALAAFMARMAAVREAINDQSRELARELDEVRPLILGCIVRRFGKVYQICQVGMPLPGWVKVYGVSVNKRGVGTRCFDLGGFKDCELLAASIEEYRKA